MTYHRYIACIQMTSGREISENLLSANEFIAQAANDGAELVILPENFALMGMNETEKVKHKEMLDHGPIQDFLRTQAIERKIWIVGGTIPLVAPHDKNKVFASCLVFNDQGKRVARYDKIHLFDVELRQTQESYLESKTTVPGDQIVVIETPFGKLGIAICYDLRFPEMFRLMLKENVELIAIPAAFTETTGAAHWDILVRARAIENLVYVAAACQTGAHENYRNTYGHSMVVNPWGTIMNSLPIHPGVIVSEIDLEFLHRIRQDFPALSHRRKI